MAIRSITHAVKDSAQEWDMSCPWGAFAQAPSLGKECYHSPVREPKSSFGSGAAGGTIAVSATGPGISKTSDLDRDFNPLWVRREDRGPHWPAEFQEEIQIRPPRPMRASASMWMAWVATFTGIQRLELETVSFGRSFGGDFMRFSRLRTNSCTIVGRCSVYFSDWGGSYGGVRRPRP